MKIFMRNVGMTLHVIHKLRAQGIDNVQVNMDWQHLIMNGENLAEYAALLAAEGLLGHQHANSGWGTFDDDNMVGATAFMETLELARRAAPRRLRRERRAARLRPVPVHGGRGRGRARQRAAVALHRLGRGADRRGGAARGAGAEGRRARVRARLRARSAPERAGRGFELRCASEHRLGRARRAAARSAARAAGRSDACGICVRALVGEPASSGQRRDAAARLRRGRRRRARAASMARASRGSSRRRTASCGWTPPGSVAAEDDVRAGHARTADVPTLSVPESAP